jgi:predicted permease
MLDDLRFALRTLIKNPGFAAAACLTLALGIGANTAVFSVVNGILLKPLPYPEPERVVYLARAFANGGMGSTLTAWKYDYFRRNTTIFEAIATHRGWATAIGEPDTAAEVRGLRASAGFFAVNGIEPAIGRAFSAEEDAPGGPPVVVLSDAVWRERFDADPGVLGRTVELGGEAHTIVGVMPAAFRFPDLPAFADFIVPYRVVADIRDRGHNYTVRARLAAGVTRDQAAAELAAVSERFRVDHPDLLNRTEAGARIVDFADVHIGGTATRLWLLLGAVGLVLLIACANVVNLLLVRSAARVREIAIRAAVGAGRGRIARQLLTENLIIALIAALFGLLIGQWALEILLALAPGGLVRAEQIAIMGEGGLPRAGEVGLDLRVLTATIAVGAGAGVLFGLAAAGHARRTDPSVTLRDGGGSARAGGPGAGRIRSSLVAAEVAIAVVLLAGAALTLASLAKLTAVEPGFEPEGVTALEFARTPETYTVEQLAGFEQRALERLRALPGVVAAGATSMLPLRGQFNFPMEVVGRPNASGEPQWHTVSPGYFETLQVPIVRGRDLTPADDAASAAPVVIINEALARTYFDDTDPIGQRIAIGQFEGQGVDGFVDPPREIVGVVADQRALGLRQRARETLYVPRAQTPAIELDALGPSGVWALGGIVVRTDGRVALGRSVIDATIREADPNVPPPRVGTMSDVIGASLEEGRFYTVLLGAFAVLALTLAAIGIYSVVAFTVQQRTGEIGIRLALGADARAVLRLVLRQAMLPVVVGLGIGLAAALGLTRLLRGLLYQMSATDPATFAVVAIALAAVGLVAALVPAKRAANVDPAISLRRD